MSKSAAGDYCEGVIPDPIPNSKSSPSALMHFVLRHEGKSLPALTKIYENQKSLKSLKKTLIQS